MVGPCHERVGVSLTLLFLAGPTVQGNVPLFPQFQQVGGPLGAVLRSCAPVLALLTNKTSSLSSLSFSSFKDSEKGSALTDNDATAEDPFAHCWQC